MLGYVQKAEMHSFLIMPIMGGCFGRSGPKKDFLQKSAEKTAFLRDTNRDHLTLERHNSLNFKDFRLSGVFWKIWDISFQISHRHLLSDQNCPIGSHLKFFYRGTQKNAKNCIFLRLANFIGFLVVEPISKVPPCESSRPDDFKNVVLFGCRTF